jgi:NAD+ synthase
MQILHSTLIQEVHKFAKNHQFQHAVLGLSGGLDSALALCIAVRAFGPNNVTALILPEVGVSDREQTERAKLLAEHFKVKTHYQPINNFLVDFNFVTWEKSETSNEHLKARMRALLLKHFAEGSHAMLIGSANKSDLSLGFGLPDGEFIGDLLPFGDLYKTELFKLAKNIGIPEELIDQEPSRDLKPNGTDLDELGANWAQIDDILKQLDRHVDPDTMIDKGMDALIVHKVNRLVQQNPSKHMKWPVLPVGQIPRAVQEAQEAEASSS